MSVSNVYVPEITSLMELVEEEGGLFKAIKNTLSIEYYRYGLDSLIQNVENEELLLMIYNFNDCKLLVEYHTEIMSIEGKDYFNEVAKFYELGTVVDEGEKERIFAFSANTEKSQNAVYEASYEVSLEIGQLSKDNLKLLAPSDVKEEAFPVYEIMSDYSGYFPLYDQMLKNFKNLMVLRSTKKTSKKRSKKIADPYECFLY